MGVSSHQIDSPEKAYWIGFLLGDGNVYINKNRNHYIVRITLHQQDQEHLVKFLNSLEGIGKQKAKQIIAYLQGKVGRFALIKEKEHIEVEKKSKIKEIIGEAKQILKRLQYSAKEIDSMVKKALQRKSQPESVEELLNQIYYQER